MNVCNWPPDVSYVSCLRNQQPSLSALYFHLSTMEPVFHFGYAKVDNARKHDWPFEKLEL